MVLWASVRTLIHHWWCDWRNTCYICGRRRDQRASIDAVPNPYLCRWCNKLLRFSANYGLSATAIKEATWHPK